MPGPRRWRRQFVATAAISSPICRWTGFPTRYSRSYCDFSASPEDAAGDTAVGFHAPRTKLGAKGNITDEISYYIQGNFSSDGGHVPDGFPLAIANPNGSGGVFYTLDGTDPRSSPSALEYLEPIRIVGNPDEWLDVSPATRR